MSKLRDAFGHGSGFDDKRKLLVRKQDVNDLTVGCKDFRLCDPDEDLLPLRMAILGGRIIDATEVLVRL